MSQRTLYTDLVFDMILVSSNTSSLWSYMVCQSHRATIKESDFALTSATVYRSNKTVYILHLTHKVNINQCLSCMVQLLCALTLLCVSE